MRAQLGISKYLIDKLRESVCLAQDDRDIRVPLRFVLPRIFVNLLGIALNHRERRARNHASTNPAASENAVTMASWMLIIVTVEPTASSVTLT